ncbi:MAG: hypothetical protein Q7J54_01470 [Candidatus Woesearchaeota archaeon]|nr:hypothetical protein [Candidatus Woesearchaeota archaeon]
MKKSNKKAMEEINPIILALIIFVILLAIFGVIIKATMRQGGEDVCLTSVIAADKSSTILEIKCEMYDAGQIKPQGATDEKKKEDAMKQIAELMRKCWRQFGEGKKDPFTKAGFVFKAVCFVCSKFSFETEGSISEDEFVDFLKNKKISEEKDAYYYDYLKGSLPEKSRNDFFIESIDLRKVLDIVHWGNIAGSTTLKSKGEYGVVIYAIEDSWASKISEKMIKKITGAEPSKSFYDIYVVPYENIERLSCDRLQG